MELGVQLRTIGFEVSRRHWRALVNREFHYSATPPRRVRKAASDEAKGMGAAIEHNRAFKAHHRRVPDRVCDSPIEFAATPKVPGRVVVPTLEAYSRPRSWDGRGLHGVRGAA